MTSGEAPLISRLPSLRDEAFAIADEMGNAHQEGHAYFTMDLCARALEQRGLSFNVCKRAGDLNPRANAIQIMTMSLKFPVVALPGVGHMPAAGEDEQEVARVFYVAATQRLLITVGGDGGFGTRLKI